MDQFKPSDFLQTLVNQTNNEQQEWEVAAFQPNKKYQREAAPESQQIEEEKNELTIQEILRKQQSSISDPQPQINKNKQKRKIDQQDFRQINEPQFNLQATQMKPQAAYDEVAYAKMMKPDVIQTPQPQTNGNLIEALKQNQFVLLQFPTLIPFEQVYDYNKDNQSYKPTIIEDPQELLKEFYSKQYDSSGYIQQKNFSQFIDPKDDVGIKFGKIVVQPDGNVKWLAAKEVFDIESGIPNQGQCISVNKENQTYTEIGDITDRFIIKPNIENLDEFFIFQIPSLYFIAAGIYRFHQLKYREVIRQSILQEDQEDDVFQVTPISVRIKQYISKWIALLYLIQMGLGALGFSYDVQNFYFALYIFSIIAQLFASHLVKLEFTMKEQQTIWAHRIFWPFQSLFLFLRLIPGNNLFMRLFVIFQFVPSLVLMAYSIYKPNDRAQLSYETPRFIKELFRSLDNIEFLKQQQQQELFLINPNKYRKKQSLSAKDHIDELYKMVGRPSQKEQETYLISQLPTRSVEIQKKFVKKFINDNEILYFYKIDTTINQKVFKSEKRYPEFVTLERQQQEKLQKLKMENIKMDKVEMKPGEDDTSFVIRRGLILQDWLAKQLEDPNQITKNLLDFLNVDDRNAQPFNIYQTVIQKKYTQPKLQQKPVDIEMGNVSVRKDPDIMSLSSEKDYSKLYITANCTGFEYGQYGSNSVDFVITVSYNVQNERQKQRILRTFSQFKESLEKIEQQMGIPVPIKITQAILKLPNQGKVAFIDKGLKQLIDQHFFCEELIELLGIEI